MGTSSIAVTYLNCLIENNFNIIASYTQPPRKKDRGMLLKKSPIHDLSLLNNIPIFHPINFKNPETIEVFKKLEPDIAIVMSYGLLLPKKILEIPNFGCINIHVSLLPRWRGASPIEHAILYGDKETGVSIFQIKEKLDSGPIIAKESINILNNVYKDDLELKLNKIGTKLLLDILPNIFLNKISKENQNESYVTYAKKISSEFRKINFNNDVTSVYNHIRAFSTSPSSWFIYKNERINIIKCSMVKCKSIPSTILCDKFHIGCANGKIIPEVIQREGKKPLQIDEFLKGFKFEVNEKVNA